MSSWRDQILREFTPQVSRLTLVADPDGLLAEEGVLQGIWERGFDLIPFEDHMAFRFAYESKYRSRWDRGELTDLVVVLRAQAHDLRSLPYDLLQAGRKLHFNLGDLFPNLSYSVVAALDRADFEALYRAQAQHKPGKLGDNATRDFVLRHVFEIAPELIKQTSALLRVLLRRHYQGQRVPPILDERLIQILRQGGRFKDWPLERIVPDREAFFYYLQERWPIFLGRLAADEGQATHEVEAAYGLAYPGPAVIPFGHDDVRVYIDSLFLDGILRPISYPQAHVLAHQWVAVGLRTNPQADRLRRLERLVKAVEASIPAPEVRHQDWLAFAQRWAELLTLWHQAKPARDEQLYGIQEEVDVAFLAWIQKRYGSLHNQPAIPPVMLHHVPRALARHLERSREGKIALVLLDGLALDQWIVLREALLQQRPDLKFREGTIFAWLPTTTAVSRQAAFAGKCPIYYPESIHTTNNEARLWTQFWINEGLAQAEIAYARGLGDEAGLSVVEDALSHPRVHVVGLVVDKVDKIMHGMELGTAGMHSQVRQWAMTGFMVKLLNLLFEHGFGVFLTSDHGNIEAIGIGRPSEGAVADLRGERVRIYPDQALRARVRERFPSAIEWPAIGLPDDFLPLLAPNRCAFVPKGKHIVGHGGISIEELVVPFVQIEWRSM